MTTTFDLIRNPDLGLTVVAASREALQAEITRPYITDLPSPGRYLSEGTLVLTSGLWARDDRNVHTFVADLVAAKTAALVIGLVEIEVVPDAVISECRAHGLPLLVTEDDIDFSEIAAAVDDDNGGLPLLERGLEFSRRLLALEAEQRGAEHLLRAFAHEFGVACWFVDARGLRAWSSDEDLPGERERARAWLRMRGSRPREDVIENEWGEVTSLYALESLDGGEGGVFACRADARAWPRGMRIAVQSVVAALRIVAARTDLPMAATRLRRDGLVDDLVEGAAPEAELATRLRMEGVDPDLLSVVATASAGAGLPDETVRGLFEDALADLGAVVGVRDGVAVVILPATPAVDEELLDRIRDCGGHARELLGQGALRVGLSDPVQGATDIGSAIGLAHERMRGATGSTTVRIGYDARAHTHQALLAGLGETARQAFADALLGPVVRYDERHSSDMLSTLAAFLDHSGSWQAAADALHIHPNTLRYRIGRVGELTRRDLSSMADRVDLYLAIACADPDRLQPQAAA